jgi:hypothetical protein
MLPLYQKAVAFLVRGGYRVTSSDPGFAELEREGDPRLMLWVEDRTLPPSASLTEAERTVRATREDALLRHMISVMQASRDGVAFFLLPSRQGLSQGFITEATRILQRKRGDGVGGIRVPVEFFDTAYKIDGASGTKGRSTALATMLSLATRRKRVAQPFSLRTSLDAGGAKPGAADLVEHLETLLMAQPDRPVLRIIDGAAGSGKSVAFEALAAVAYAEFMAAKQSAVLRPRPIVFLPEHIRGHTIGYVDDIVDAMIESESASPVEPEQLRFLLSEGHAIWMLDGLDEILGGDNDLFSFFTEQLASPESRAQIILCTRDSLLTSNTALRAFIDQAAAKRIAVEIYELSPWTESAWRDLAWMELEQGRRGAERSPLVEGFVSALVKSPDLSELARLPFYCSVLLEQYRKTKVMPADGLAVLDTILDRMLAREEGKAMFQWRDFVDADVLAELADGEDTGIDRGLLAGAMGNGQSMHDAVGAALDAAGRDNVVELLGLIAHQRTRRTARRKTDAGVALEDLTGIMQAAYMPDGGSNGEANASQQGALSTALVQFAFFGAGRRAGLVDFTHPILADYLAGLYAASVLDRAAHAAESARALSRVALMRGTLNEALGDAPLQSTSMFARTLQRELKLRPAAQAFLREAAQSLNAREVPAAASVFL